MFAALILITLAAALPAVLASWVKALVAGAMFKLFNLLNFSHTCLLLHFAFHHP